MEFYERTKHIFSASNLLQTPNRNRKTCGNKDMSSLSIKIQFVVKQDEKRKTCCRKM